MLVMDTGWPKCSEHLHNVMNDINIYKSYYVVLCHIQRSNI